MDAGGESSGGAKAQTKRKPAGQKRKAENQAGKLKADGESESSQRKRKVKGQGTKQKVGTESGGGARAQTKRKGKAKRVRESDLSDTIKVNTISGGNGERVPPVPIPNTEVKPLSADGTWLETARESRTPPDSNKEVVM